MEFQKYFDQLKRNLDSQNQYRKLVSARGIDFCSNDYLGYSNNTALKKIFLNKLQSGGLGSSGSRLLRGENNAIRDLEETLAIVSESEAATFFPTGYQANVALLSTLLKNDSVVFSDERNHASIIDGIRLAGCEKHIFKHNDLENLAELISKHDADKMKFVVVESIYSMEGDFTPLAELVDLCEQSGASLIVDEAHATGLFGDGGSGLAEELGLHKKIFARIHTAGKALGAAGAWVSGSNMLKDFLVNYARPFIYSTGPSFPQIALVQSAIEHWKIAGRQEAAACLQRVSLLRERLQNWTGGSVHIPETSGPILTIKLGSNSRALTIAGLLQESGFDVRAIRPPTVPEGEAMLRITIPANRTPDELEKFESCLTEIIGGAH